MRLDGNPAFAFKIHRIQQLILHIARGNRARAMQKAVGKGRFAVVNVGNDAEISNVCCVHLQILTII